MTLEMSTTATLAHTATPIPLCDSCYGETPATREVWYVVDPDTEDARGGTLPICDRPECLAKAREHVALVGDESDVVVTRPAGVHRPRLAIVR